MKISSAKATAFGRYELEFYDGFDGPALDTRHWLPHYLPQWSSRQASQATYNIVDGTLVLRIANDQKPWCPEFNGAVRVSSLQTGVFSGALGSRQGQHRFADTCVVREVQETVRLYTPRYGYFELRAKCALAANNVAALWMIGFEDTPEKSAEICIFELKGGNVGEQRSSIGYGIHPFGDPSLEDEFFEDAFDVNMAEFNTYAAEWTATAVHFYINGAHIRTIHQSPAYEMQFMLNIYDLENLLSPNAAFIVDYVAGYKPGIGAL